MKNKAFLMLVFTVFVLTACAAVPAGGIADGQLNDVQLYIIGMFASAIVYVLQLVSQRFPKVVIKRAWVIVFLYVASLGLSFLWQGFTLPEFGAFIDPVTFVSSLFGFITALFVALGPSVAFATLIYNVFLKKVFDAAALKMGWQ